MALDRDAFRSMVSTIVQDWARETARGRGLDLADTRANRWMESLVRERLRDGLLDAPDRGGLPGQTGVAEIGPPLPIDADVYYIDSGFLDVGNFSLVDPLIISESTLYQSTRTSAINAKRVPDSEIQLGPFQGEEVDAGVPPAFTADPLLWQKTRNNLNGTQMAAGNSTGKLRLYNAAKLGRDVEDYDATEIIDPGINVSLNGRGIFTEADGHYWTVVIDGSLGTADFTKLDTPPDLRTLVSAAKLVSDDDVILQAEMYALGYSTATTETQSVTFDATGIAGLPVAYSAWKFNWEGSEAKAVLHESTGLQETVNDFLASVISRVVTLSISQDSGGNFIVAPSLDSSQTWGWQYTLDTIWRPTGGSSAQICLWVPGGPPIPPTTNAEPSNVPIYGYYVADSSYKNETWELATWSRSSDAPGETSEPGPGCALASQQVFYCGGTWSLYSLFNGSGARVVQSAAFAGTQRSGKRRDHYIDQEIISSEQTLTQDNRFITPAGGFTPLNYSCTTSGCLSSPAGDTFPGGASGESIVQHYDVTATRRLVEGADMLSGGAMIIPFDNAESVILLEHKGRQNSTGGDFEIVYVPDRPWASGWWGAVYDALGELIGDFTSSGGVQTASVGIISITQTSSIAKISASYASVFGRYSAPITVSDTDSSSDNGDAVSTFGAAYTFPVKGAETACTGGYDNTIQGVGPEIRVWLGDTTSENGYPAALESVLRTAVIGNG